MKSIGIIPRLPFFKGYSRLSVQHWSVNTVITSSTESLREYMSKTPKIPKIKINLNIKQQQQQSPYRLIRPSRIDLPTFYSAQLSLQAIINVPT